MAFIHPARTGSRWASRSAVLTIRRKILFAFLATGATMGVLGAYAIHGATLTGGLMSQTFDQALMSISYARAAAADFAAMQSALALRRVYAAQPARVADLDGRHDELAISMDSNLAIVQQRTLSPRLAKVVEDVQRRVSEWQGQRSLALTGQPALPDWVALEAAEAEINERIDILINLAAGDGFRHRERALAQTEAVRRVTLILLIAALGVSGSVALLLARQIMGPVKAASAAAGAIAEGELATDIPQAGQDELGQLLAAMAMMRDSIRTMMDREIAQRRSAQGRLVDALESSREGVLLVDSSGRVAVANSRLAEFFPSLTLLLAPGTPFGRLAATGVQHRLFADTAPGREGLRRQLLQPGPLPVEARLADGRWLRISRSATQDGGVVAICSDISDVKQREGDLQEANLYLDAALNNMVQGLCLFGPDQRLRLANRRYAEIFKLGSDVVVPGASLHSLLSAAMGQYGNTSQAALEADLLGRAHRQQAERFTRELSTGRVLEVSHSPMADGGWVATIEDITERRQSEQRISFLARHDPLTLLPNRVQFIERMEIATASLGRGERFAVLCLDLDGFKSINDSLGHAAGNRLLRAVGERLTACTRETDVVAHLGSDEFAIIQTGVDRPEDAGELAQRLMDTLAQPFTDQAKQVSLRASVGIAHAPGDGASSEVLLRNADSALDRAKRDGGGAFRSFEPETDARLQARRAMELDLRQALANGELVVFYQPLVDTVAQNVIGFEALVRWRHPERGMVSPATFIPLAEATGLIVSIGEWVLRTACAEARRWPGRLKVAVNVSPMQFGDPRLADTVADALADSGLPPDRLELEVTESVLLQSDTATLAMLHRLRDLGTRISMDDFGTGYSSLSYLRSFPFDKIKIDQSFIRDLGVTPDAAAIVRAIAGLGHSLGMRTTAEGVETREQMMQLREFGCTELQGYYYSKPRPAEELGELIARIDGEAVC